VADRVIGGWRLTRAGCSLTAEITPPSRSSSRTSVWSTHASSPPPPPETRR